MKYIDYRIITGIILIFAFLIFTKHHTEERHYHEIVTCTYAGGVKSVNLVFCHTEQAQVVFDNIHRHNLRAERFFNGELRGCE